jgi:chorismate mutase/prephenate dehydratase
MVNHTLDLFVDSDLLIYGEVLQEVSHSLMSKTGKKEAISRIVSHPQAIAQCHRFLETNFKGVEIVDIASTAKAAQMVVTDSSSAAIASAFAARLYGLAIIEEKIEDYANNVTRFLVISQKPSERTTRDKTSLLFSIKDKSGALHDLLRPFAERGINLMKIESRPSKKKVWEYLFYIDIGGNQQEERISAALEQIAKDAIFLKVLGSYPMAERAG